LTYEVVFLRVFLKQFRRLPRDAKSRIQVRVEELSRNPYLGLRLMGQLDGFWKDRVGQYRIIYKIDEKSKAIVFYDVDLRKRVYE
jgi:mRNA interferase RelE/StbE